MQTFAQVLCVWVAAGIGLLVGAGFPWLGLLASLLTVGTLGILEEAYRKTLITELREIYQNLLATGTYLDRRLLDKSLQSFQLPPL